MVEKKSEYYLLWLFCLLILLVTTYFGISNANLILEKLIIEDFKLSNFVMNSMSFSITIIILFYWFFYTFLLHTITIIIDINVDTNFSKLLCFNGIGFIFILFVLLINKLYIVKATCVLPHMNGDCFNEFCESEIFDVIRLRTNIGYALYFIWGVVQTKRIYKLTMTNTLILTLVIILFFSIVQFIKDVI